MKKYELTNETVNSGKKLYLIRALRDIGSIKVGSYGGWVECEENLSQDGDCWICDNGVVCDEAVVSGNALVGQNARVSDNARVYDNAIVSMNARVSGHAQVHDNAHVFGYCRICDYANIYDEAQVGSFATVEDEAEIFGNVEVIGDATIAKNACVHCKTNVFCVQGLGERNLTATFFLCRDNRIRVQIGSMVCTLDKFKESVDKLYKNTFYAQVAYLTIETAKAHIVGGFNLERKKMKKENAPAQQNTRDSSCLHTDTKDSQGDSIKLQQKVPSTQTKEISAKTKEIPAQTEEISMFSMVGESLGA